MHGRKCLTKNATSSNKIGKSAGPNYGRSGSRMRIFINQYCGDERGKRAAKGLAKIYNAFPEIEAVMQRCLAEWKPTNLDSTLRPKLPPKENLPDLIEADLNKIRNSVTLNLTIIRSGEQSAIWKIKLMFAMKGKQLSFAPEDFFKLEVNATSGESYIDELLEFDLAIQRVL